MSETSGPATAMRPRSGGPLGDIGDRDSTHELLTRSVSYERWLQDYFSELLYALGGDAAAIWSIDGVHFEYLQRDPHQPQREALPVAHHSA